MNKQASSRFTAIDAAIISAVRQAIAPVRFNAIMPAPGVEEAAKAVATPDRHGVVSTDRVVDRRLQALRKAGKLTFSHASGWSIP